MPANIEGRVQESWESYREACYGGLTLSHIQNKEVRQAFLSGMWSALNTMIEISAGDVDVAAELLEVFRNEVMTALEILVPRKPNSQEEEQSI